MTVDPGSNSAQQGSVGTAPSAPVVPAQQGPVEPSQQGPVEAEATPEVTGHLAGDPLSLGLPSFIIGSVALGMVLVGFVSPLGTGASLPIILARHRAGADRCATLSAMRRSSQSAARPCVLAHLVQDAG